MPTSKLFKKNHTDNMSARPHKWWQWVLLYPTLFISLFASIPTFYEAYYAVKVGVSFGESKKAIEQKDFWNKNLSCKIAPLESVITPNNTKVDVTICETGDVLIKVFKPEGENAYEWVGVDSVGTKMAFNAGLIKTAYADVIRSEKILLASNGTVLCQKSLGSGKILRRISVPGQGCFDEIINAYTGLVESKRPAPCDSQC